MTLIYFLIVIGSLVFVHEFGHFIMAKRAGVRVEKFSLGMGPKIAGYKKGDTEYVLSALPLGGYVKMAGENPDEEPTGAPDEFQSKTVWQRAKIAATGPLTNIVLAFRGPRKGRFRGKGLSGRAVGFPCRRRDRGSQRPEHQRLDQGAVPHRRESRHGRDGYDRSRR